MLLQCKRHVVIYVSNDNVASLNVGIGDHKSQPYKETDTKKDRHTGIQDSGIFSFG